jgi:uncharacterized protein (TIGR02466 family)
MQIFGDTIHAVEGTEAAFNESKELYEKYKDSFEKHEGWELWNHSLSDPTFASNILLENNCTEIINTISEAIKQYLTGVGHTPDTVSGFNITESWLTHTVREESARQHNHGSADIAGVYYIQSNPETDGNLYFLAPESIRTVAKLYRFAENQYDVSPVENTMVLFPGWMPHGTRPHKGDTPRISLSFNIGIEYK